MRWIHGSYYSDLCNGLIAIGIVYRGKLGWWGYCKGTYTDEYTTRANAIRAVASLADVRKYPV